jgi:predicted esterase
MVAIYYPKNFTPAKKWPLFIAMAPGAGAGVRALFNYREFADNVGFLIAAPELPVEQDIEDARYYYALLAINKLNSSGYIRNQPVWIGGFSGGGKWALQLGAYGGDIFSGILAIGCNEDYATLGLKEYKNNRALDILIYLLNGTEDEVAGTKRSDYPEMINSIKNSGFRNVTVETYPGAHSIPYKETLQAFNYLKSRH